MVSPFTAYLAERYADLKNLAAELGRRKAKLRLLGDFWALPAEEKERLARLTEDPQIQGVLSDALEDINTLGGEEEGQIAEFVDEGSIAGVVVRTDYSDDAAWVGFVEALMEAEKDLAMPIDEERRAAGGGASGSTAQGDTEGNESGSESEDEEMASPSSSSASSSASLFALLSPPASSPLRARLTGISNLSALRLLNEANAVQAPAPPQGTQRAKSSVGHRLTSLHGFVEEYSGPILWVYDMRSNTDRAVRVVSQCAEGVGAATADSWRARASFLPELQLNLASGAMKIDFGGLDRWDHSERQRSMAEADTSSF